MGRFSPHIKGFEVSRQYMDFLVSLSNYVGASTENICPVNMRRIMDSSRYLSSD